MSIRNQLTIEFEDGNLFSLQDAFDLGFKKGSVSSALSRGVKTNDFERVDRGLYKVIKVYYEKLLGTQHYCNSEQLTNFLIFTVEPNDDNQEAWLLERIIEWTEDTCSTVIKDAKQNPREFKELGYQQRITDKRKPKFERFEVIET